MAVLLLAFMLALAPSLALAAGGDFVYAKQFGGSGNEYGKSVATDASGNVYTVGYFSGTVDFDPGAGTANLTSSGSDDVFISKIDSSGNHVWAKNIGSTSTDQAFSVATDSSGNVYVAGMFRNTVDFDPGAGTAYIASAGVNDIFVLKLDSSGNYVWAKRMGGTGADYAYSVIVDSDGSVYSAGYFNGTADFDPGAGTANLTSAGIIDAFVSKLDSSGNYVWAKSMGDTGFDQVYSLGLDAGHNIYATGYFSGTVDFDPGAGTASLTSAGGRDVFVSKLDSSGNYVWAKQMGGTTDDHGMSMALDPNGNVYTAGYFSGSDGDFDPGAGTAILASAGTYDAFVSKLDSSGNYVWAKSMGGVEDDFAYGIAVDPYGNAFVSGHFSNTADFDPGAGTANLTVSGLTFIGDIFVSKLDSSGGFVYAKQIGSVDAYDYGYAIDLDSSNNVYVTGVFNGLADFDPGAGTSNLTPVGGADAYLFKLEATPPDTTAPVTSFTSPSSGSTVSGASIVISVTASDDMAVSGVQFKVDGINTGSEDIVAPYSVTWDSTAVADGTHTAMAVARDPSGNYSTSTISFTVANTPPAPSTPPPAPGSQTAVSVPSMSYAELRTIFGDRAVRTSENTATNQSSTVSSRQELLALPQIISAASEGVRMPEILVIQKVLNSDPATRVSQSGPGSPGRETNLYGPATRAAVQRFQIRHGIVKSPRDLGYGVVGPKTRAKMNEILGGR